MCAASYTIPAFTSLFAIDFRYLALAEIYRCTIYTLTSWAVQSVHALSNVCLTADMRISRHSAPPTQAEALTPSAVPDSASSLRILVLLLLETGV